MAAKPDLTFLADTAAVLPWIRDYWDPEALTPGRPGTDLLDPADLLQAVRRRWPTSDASTASTLWWYLSSSTLTLVPVAQMMVTGRSFDPSSDAITVRTDNMGAVDALTSSRTAEGPAELAAGLRRLFSAVVAALPDAHPPSLWAIASDSIANRLLDVGAAVGRVGEAAELATELATECGAPLPRPRFVDVAGTNGGSRTFLQRSSCCLLYRVGESQCTSCPHRPPAERTARWAALVS